MKSTRVLTLLLALALLVGAAPPARTAEPLNRLNDADATERPAFDFASLGLTLRLGSPPRLPRVLAVEYSRWQDKLGTGRTGPSVVSVLLQRPQ